MPVSVTNFETTSTMSLISSCFYLAVSNQKSAGLSESRMCWSLLYIEFLVILSAADVSPHDLYTEVGSWLFPGVIDDAIICMVCTWIVSMLYEQLTSNLFYSSKTNQKIIVALTNFAVLHSKDTENPWNCQWWQLCAIRWASHIIAASYLSLTNAAQTSMPSPGNCLIIKMDHDCRRWVLTPTCLLGYPTLPIHLCGLCHEIVYL